MDGGVSAPEYIPFASIIVMVGGCPREWWGVVAASSPYSSYICMYCGLGSPGDFEEVVWKYYTLYSVRVPCGGGLRSTEYIQCSRVSGNFRSTYIQYYDGILRTEYICMYCTYVFYRLSINQERGGSLNWRRE